MEGMKYLSRFADNEKLRKRGLRICQFQVGVGSFSRTRNSYFADVQVKYCSMHFLCESKGHQKSTENVHIAASVVTLSTFSEPKSKPKKSKNRSQLFQSLFCFGFKKFKSFKHDTHRTCANIKFLDTILTPFKSMMLSPISSSRNKKHPPHAWMIGRLERIHKSRHHPPSLLSPNYTSIPSPTKHQQSGQT